MHGFYKGFKLHIIINQKHAIISIEKTKANVHDVQLLKQEDFIKWVKGILIGDKGYILAAEDHVLLKTLGIECIAKQPKNIDSYLNIVYADLLKKTETNRAYFWLFKRKM